MADNTNLMLEVMASLGGSTNPQGPAGNMGDMANQWIQNQSYINMMKQMMGNEALQNMTLADTAGLTPEHMSNIMKTNLAQRGLDQRSLADAYDAAYKAGIINVQGRQAGTQRLIARRKQGEIDRKLDERIPVKINGITTFLTPKEWFNVNENTTQFKNYLSTLEPNESPSGKGFESYQVKMATLTGGQPLEDKVREKEAFADVKTKKYFTDPSGLAKTIDDRINSEEVQNRLFSLDPSEKPRALSAEKSSIIANEITAAGGDIVDRRQEGSIRIWTVKWPDGTTSEVRHAF